MLSAVVVVGEPISSKNMQKPTRVYHTHAHLKSKVRMSVYTPMSIY